MPVLLLPVLLCFILTRSKNVVSITHCSRQIFDAQTRWAEVFFALVCASKICGKANPANAANPPAQQQRPDIQGAMHDIPAEQRAQRQPLAAVGAAGSGAAVGSTAVPEGGEQGQPPQQQGTRPGRGGPMRGGQLAGDPNMPKGKEAAELLLDRYSK